MAYFEELLVEHERYSTDLVHCCLLHCKAVFKVGCDCKCQFPSQFLPIKSQDGTSVTVCTNEDIEIKVCCFVVVRTDLRGKEGRRVVRDGKEGGIERGEEGGGRRSR